MRIKRSLVRETMAPATRELLWTFVIIFTSCTALVSIALIMFLAPHRSDFGIQSTSRFDNVEIAGTTDATGVVTARAGVRLTTPATGPLLTSGSAIPVGAGTLGSLYMRTSNPATLYQNTDGATNWTQIAGITNSAGANVLMKSDGTNAVASTWTDGAVAGTTSTTSSLTAGDAVGDIFTATGDLSKFGNTSGLGATYIYNNTINAGYTQSGTFELALNFLSDNAGTGNFRNTNIYNGKGASACLVTGSTKVMNCVGGLQVNGTNVQLSTTPSLAIANGSPGGTVTLATEGTIDWLAFLGDYYTSRPTTQTAATKVGGGYLLHSFETRAGSTALGHNNSSIAGTTIVGTAADNMGGGAFSATLYYTMFASNSGQQLYGWSMTVPASTTQRILRLYVSVFNCTITTDAKLTKSGTTQSDNFTIGAVQTNKLITITYTGNGTGEDLIVTSSCTTNPSNGSYAITAATLGII